MERYPAIRLWTRLALIFSWIIGISLALSAFGFLLRFSQMGETGLGVLIFLGELLLAVFVWLGIRVLPELLTAIVAIEVNTRSLASDPSHPASHDAP